MSKTHKSQVNKQEPKPAPKKDAGNTTPARITTPASHQLTVAESKDLQLIEERIAGKINSFFDVAEDLMLVEERSLWKQDYKSFLDYCRKRWDYGRSYCSRLRDAKSVVDDLKTVPIGNTLLPANEAQARIFFNLDKQQRITLAERVGDEMGDKLPNAAIFQKYKKELFADKCVIRPAKTKDTNNAVVDVEVLADVLKDKPTHKKMMELAMKLDCMFLDKERDGVLGKILGQFKECVGPWVEWENEVSQKN